ncbi:MAG: hypothetical protein ACI88A_003872 [Paraglaciecola sp.]|jgi:hypothetical protein
MRYQPERLGMSSPLIARHYTALAVVNTAPLHMVSANALVVRRLKTVTKSKEITAISY